MGFTRRDKEFSLGHVKLQMPSGVLGNHYQLWVMGEP